MQGAEVNSQESQVTNPTNHLSDLLELFTQKAVNVALWLRDEMDELTQGLSWVLMPAFGATSISPVRESRSLTGEFPAEEFEAAIAQLADRGMVIPSTARGAYQDLRLAGTPMRLYALTWPFLSPDNIPEWTLVLLLDPQSGSSLPHGIKLRVQDQAGLVVQRMYNQHSPDTFLYVLIAGRWDEKFVATITLADDVALKLPPFAFRP